MKPITYHFFSLQINHKSFFWTNLYQEKKKDSARATELHTSIHASNKELVYQTEHSEESDYCYTLNSPSVNLYLLPTISNTLLRKQVAQKQKSKKTNKQKNTPVIYSHRDRRANSFLSLYGKVWRLERKIFQKNLISNYLIVYPLMWFSGEYCFVLK